jgi:hypothetical protein
MIKLKSLFKTLYVLPVLVAFVFLMLIAYSVQIASMLRNGAPPGEVMAMVLARLSMLFPYMEAAATVFWFVVLLLIVFR